MSKPSWICGVDPPPEELKLKHPTIIFYMKKLEEYLGATLFERRKNRIFLTHAASLLLPYARQILSCAEEAEAILLKSIQNAENKITIGCTPIVGKYILPILLNHLRQAFPSVNVDSKIEKSDIIAILLANFQIDFGILMEHHIEKYDFSKLPLLDDVFGVVLNPSHPLAHIESIHPILIENDHWLIRERGALSRIAFDEWISIVENEQILQTRFQNCSDVIFRELRIQEQTSLLFVFVEGMIDADKIVTNVLKPLLYNGLPQDLGAIDSVAQWCEQGRVPILSAKKLSGVEDIVDHILKGNVSILADGENKALLADVAKYETRAIEEPFNEAIIRGSKEGFTELLRTNTTMLRRILATPKLKFESITVGKITRTDVIIAYLEDIVSTPVLSQVRKRIRIDGILESVSIEETHFSLFRK